MKSRLNRLLVLPLTICVFLFSGCMTKKVHVENDSMLNTIPLGSICEYNEQSDYKANDVVLIKYLNPTFSKEMTCCLRIAGLPGDTIEVQNGRIFRNGREFPFPPTAVLNYQVSFGKGADSLQQIKLSGLTKSYLQDSYFSSLSELIALRNKKVIDSFKRKPFNSSDKHFVLDASFTKDWNMDYFGPVRIKRQGEDLLNDEYKFYYGTKSYDRQVNNNFYFVVADNFYQSFDSRTVGLIPKANILGRILKTDITNARREIKVN